MKYFFIDLSEDKNCGEWQMYKHKVKILESYHRWFFKYKIFILLKQVLKITKDTLQLWFKQEKLQQSSHSFSMKRNLIDQ